MTVKILVADDEPALQRLMYHYFKHQIDRGKLMLTFVHDGIAALEQVQATPDIDVVLCDVNMPGMDGLTLLTHISQVNPAIKTIIVSAYGNMKNIRTAMNHGAFDFVTKPIDFEDLESTILRALRQALETREALNTIEIHRQHIEQIASASARFVPREFLRVLEKESILDVQLGDQVQRDMTIMFADIRDFTTLSEHMSPQENFNFINSFLSRVSPIIREHNGFIDKYLGDGIMALFPGGECSQQADDAVNAAVAVQQEVIVYNSHRANSGYQPIRLGIGVHTGSVMLGTVGEAERMEGTVISDTVNLASRIEGLTRLYGAAVIVSEHTLASLTSSTRYPYRFLDKVQVKGKQEAVSVFEILDSSITSVVSGKLATRTLFEQGLTYYHQGAFAQAAASFEHVLAANPTDQAARLLLNRARSFSEHGVPVGWEGVEVLHEK